MSPTSSPQFLESWLTTSVHCLVGGYSCESIHSISRNMLMAENLANQLLVICSWFHCWQISVGFLHDFLHEHWTSFNWRFITTSIHISKESATADVTGKLKAAWFLCLIWKSMELTGFSGRLLGDVDVLPAWKLTCMVHCSSQNHATWNPENHRLPLIYQVL